MTLGSKMCLSMKYVKKNIYITHNSTIGTYTLKNNNNFQDK